MATLSADDSHLQQNPVFKILMQDGIASGPIHYKFPAPKFSDQQDGAQQQLLLSEMLSDDLRPRFLRDSVVAPHVIKLGEQAVSDGSSSDHIRYADFLFAVHAPLNDVMQSDFWERVGQGRGEGTADEEDERDADSSDSATGHVLTVEQLTARQITVLNEPDRREALAFGENRILKRVDVAATTRSCWTRSDRSVVAAFMIDPRFQEDLEFANRWWPLVRNDAGDLTRGEPQPYRGAGGYIRLTQLATPQGCLIAEGHVAFMEPRGWFGGANLLASKLPTIVQSEIRRIRRALK